MEIANEGVIRLCGLSPKATFARNAWVKAQMSRVL